MEISAPSAQRQQIAEIEKQTKEQSQVHFKKYPNSIFFFIHKVLPCGGRELPLLWYYK
jgi:hypothetical protein